MKKRGLKKFAAGVTLLLALGLLAGCGGEKKEAGSKAQLNVGIVQLVEHSALDAANKGFVDGLAEKGFKERLCRRPGGKRLQRKRECCYRQAERAGRPEQFAEYCSPLCQQ